LPVPLWLWIGAAVAAVILSFVLMAAFVTLSHSGTPYPQLDLLRFRIGRALASLFVRRAIQSVAVALLALVVAAGLFGDQTPTRNIAPTLIWIVWWVGFAYLSALVGNVWAVVNPWNALFGAYEVISTRWPQALPQSHGREWPLSLGVWPAVALLFAFAWIELVYDGRSIPSRLAWLCVAYSVLTWAGMFAFGRTVWLRNADPFANAFGVFARFAPTERHEREWKLRPFGAGLLDARDVTPSMMVFVLLLLSTVTFDGFTATAAWARFQDALYAALPGSGNARLTFIGTVGIGAFAGIFVAHLRLLRSIDRYRRPRRAHARRGRVSIRLVARAHCDRVSPRALLHLPFDPGASSSFDLRPIPLGLGGTCSVPHATDPISALSARASRGTRRSARSSSDMSSRCASRTSSLCAHIPAVASRCGARFPC
jgi:hypothetical protein